MGDFHGAISHPHTAYRYLQVVIRQYHTVSYNLILPTGTCRSHAIALWISTLYLEGNEGSMGMAHNYLELPPGRQL